MRYFLSLRSNENKSIFIRKKKEKEKEDSYLDSFKEETETKAYLGGLFWNMNSMKQELREYRKTFVLVAKSCLTLCNPMDCTPPGSSVHGIFQARILEWLPFPSPRDSPEPWILPT